MGGLEADDGETESLLLIRKGSTTGVSSCLPDELRNNSLSGWMPRLWPGFMVQVSRLGKGQIQKCRTILQKTTLRMRKVPITELSAQISGVGSRRMRGINTSMVAGRGNSRGRIMIAMMRTMRWQ